VKGPGPIGLGGRWLRGEVTCDRCIQVWSYIDLRTGRFVSQVRERATRLVDLDEPDLEVPLCAPLRRRPLEDYVGPPFEEATFRRPWLLTELRQERGYVRVRRCGRRNPVIVGPCRSRGCDVQLGRRHVVWLDGGVVRAFDLVTRRRFVVGKVKPSLEPGSLHLTRHRVYVVPYSGGEVQVAPLPRRRPT
jgi:hypothetical protein